MAQPFHHTILPLATLADRRTEIRWGLRDFERRFGRRPTGLWLPETAVDLATLSLLVDEGVTHTILAPWQLAGEGLDTRRPYRVEVGDGRSIVVVAYDGGLSASVSFETDATTDADRFARERVVPRLSEWIDGDDGPTPFALIATDGELYGHHQPYRDFFLQRLVRAGGPGVRDRDARRCRARGRPGRRRARGDRRAELVELPSRRRAVGDRVRLRRRRRLEGAAARGAGPPGRVDRRPDRRDRSGRCRARRTRGRRATPMSMS